MELRGGGERGCCRGREAGACSARVVLNIDLLGGRGADCEDGVFTQS